MLKQTFCSVLNHEAASLISQRIDFTWLKHRTVRHISRIVTSNLQSVDAYQEAVPSVSSLWVHFADLYWHHPWARWRHARTLKSRGQKLPCPSAACLISTDHRMWHRCTRPLQESTVRLFHASMSQTCMGYKTSLFHKGWSTNRRHSHGIGIIRRERIWLKK